MGSLEKLFATLYLLYVTFVTYNKYKVDMFNITIELDFVTAFQKYITHGVFGKIIFNFIL